LKSTTHILFFSLFFVYGFSNVFQINPQIEVIYETSIQKDTLAARHLLQKEKTYTEEGDYQGAIKVLQQVYDLYSKHGLWENAIQSVISLAKRSDNYDTADLKIKYANLSLDLAQQYLPKEHLLYASAFRQKAEALMMIGKLDSANTFLIQAIPIFTKHQSWANLGWSELFLGLNYLNQYQLDNSHKHFKSVEKLLQEPLISLSEEDRTNIQSTLLSFLGLLYEFQGDYDKAIQNTQQALALEFKKTQLSATDSFYIRGYYNNLGALYLIKGDYQRSLDNFMLILSDFKQASKDVTLFSNIGELFRRQGNYALAIDYFQKSLFFENTNEEQLKAQIDALNGLGDSYKYLGLYDSAMYYCQQAILLPTHYRKSVIWGMMGSIEVHKKSPQKALEYSNKAERIYQQDSTANSHSAFYLSSIYRLVGDAYFLRQNFNTALTFYQKALIANHATFQDSLNVGINPTLEGIYEPSYFWKTMKRKAKTLASFPDSSKKLETALSTYQVLIQWTDSLQASHATETASLDWSGEFKQIYEEAISVAFRLYQSTRKSDYLDLAFSFSEKSKNSLLLESIKANEGKFIVGVPDSLLQKEKDLNIDIAFYGKSLQKAQDEKEESKTKLYQSYLSQSRLQLVELREKLEQDFPRFHALKYRGETTSIATLQSKLLNKQSAFVEYFVGDSSTFAFVITQNSTDFLQLKKPSTLQKEAANFFEVLLNPKAFQQDAKTAFADYQSKAHILYQSVLQPVLSSLSTDIQRLILVPDGFLNAIPLEALTKTNETTAGFDFAKLPYVLYDYSIQYAYSADLLLQNQARQSQIPVNAKCLAFAPSYQKGQIAVAQRGSLQQLRNTTGNLEGTAREIEAIAQFFDGQFDFGETATERQFKKFAPEFGILHLAMHGIPDFDNANFNHLQFSNLETDTLEDNLLHHYEIANMDLQAQLVVLSACETGVGKYEKGEGVYSLARSFMYAGVPSVVMSLWKVSDESTSELMPYFYESLYDGESKEGALQDAKIRFLAEANLEYRHPFYWSAFVVMGDATAINRGYGNWVWCLGIGVFIFVGMVFWFGRKRKP